MKKTILIAIFLFSTGCLGWRPLYQTNDQSVNDKISKITFFPINNVTQYPEKRDLYNALLDLQNSVSGTVKRYDLHYSLHRQQIDQATLGDDSLAIVRLEYRVEYTLDNGQQQQHFQSQTSATFTADHGPLQNERLAERTGQLTMESLAKSILGRIASFLRENPEW